MPTGSEAEVLVRVNVRVRVRVKVRVRVRVRVWVRVWLSNPNPSPNQVLGAARALQARGARAVLVTLGANGALLLTADGDIVRQPPCAVPGGAVVDETGAGDSFRGAFCVALVEGRPASEALALAAAAG